MAIIVPLLVVQYLLHHLAVAVADTQFLAVAVVAVLVEQEV